MATGTGNLPYPGKVYNPFDILTAEELNEDVSNIESLADGSGIGDGAVTTQKLGDQAITQTKIEDSGALPITYSSTYDAGSNATVRKLGGVVSMIGTFTRDSGSVTNGDTVGTLPVGYRPASNIVSIGMGTGTSTCKVRVGSNGVLDIVSAPSPSTSFVDFAGITFIAAD